MSEYGAITEAGTVRIERLLPGPIERVWTYLTNSQQRGKWLATGEMELRVGGKVELRFHHADLSPQREPIPERYKSMENGHTMFGKITRCDVPRLLSYTWGKEPHESEVTFELTAQGNEVLLVLTHRRLADRAEMISVAGGWHTHLAILMDNLNERTPRPFWTTHARIDAEYRRRFAEINDVKPGT